MVGRKWLNFFGRWWSRRSLYKRSLVNLYNVEPRVGQKALVVCGPNTRVESLIHDVNDVYMYSINDVDCGKGMPEARFYCTQEYYPKM